VLCGMTILVWRRREFYGQVLLVLAMAYGLWRFAIEYVRDDPERGFFAGFSTSQLISLAIVPLAGFFYFKQRAEHRAKPTKVYSLDFGFAKASSSALASDASVPDVGGDEKPRKSRAMVSDPDYYAVLGVQPTASPDDVKDAYKLLVKKHHPDVKPGAGVTMIQLNEEYAVLHDPEKRARYDSDRKPSSEPRKRPPGKSGLKKKKK